jgi:uncharacterized protein (TIGR02145 family)
MKRSILFLSAFLMAALIESSCKKEKTIQLSSITTLAIASITETSAISGGNISNSGGGSITAKGVVWSTSPNPTLSINQGSTNHGAGSGSFSSNLTGLIANETYFVRAYATNSAGTAYGNELSFITATGSGGAGGIGGISALNCNGGTNTGTLIAGTPANSVSSTVLYTGGNGGIYSGQAVNSTGVTGLTATLTAGTFANGSGSLLYIISGIPSSGGTARFALNIGGKTCTLSRTVEIVSNPGAGVTFNGYTYTSMVLGNGQEWMSQNLNTTQYNDGTPITLVSDPSQWSTNSINVTTLPMMCWYNNDEVTYTANSFGALYNWHAVSPTTNGNRNICPVGWHVPTDVEWTILTDYLGGENFAGVKMKSTGTQFWQSPNQHATNESGFSGLPGGARGDWGTFSAIGINGYWWSSSQSDATKAKFRGLDNALNSVIRGDGHKNTGCSVRCIKD